MSESHQTITVTHLVLETQSPMAINTGGRETQFDTELMRNVNGLPVIPATAIAGVWRHLAQQALPDCADLWFGCTEQASVVSISNGELLDSHGRRVENYLSKEQLEDDPILSLCLNQRPHHRDRVAINDRGVAKDTGKFDQIVLPKGLRFQVTLEWGDKPHKSGFVPQQDDWQQLLSLWSLRTFALGANTRNGLGQIKVIASTEHKINLKQNRAAGTQLTKVRQECLPTQHQLSEVFDADDAGQSWSIPLIALDNWRCGQGTQLLSKSLPRDSVNIITYSEPTIDWQKGQARITEPVPILCGSSIKGMLAHRIAYHYRRIEQQWAQGMADASHDEWQQRPKALSELLGCADDESENNIAGSLWVEDATLDFEHTVIRQHNSIDRFTGGVRKGALFSEELLYQPRFTINLYLAKPLTDTSLEQALNCTIEDLQAGMLPMGAGSGRGASLVIKDEQGVMA
ncbi:RAMP superfamily CRISPR-associated protein [Vibrio sp. WXL210]|uniref:RAMP superfamily CRISPR-associated protein n=1 Tax=Vibrio sp. WXL210 TaxID=3450709 RepID=UPI003EC8700D